MRISFETTLTQETLNFSYLPALLKKNKSGWMIEYWAENPLTHQMQRKRIRVEHIRKRYSRQSEATSHCLKIINEINLKLMKGWNPFVLPENARLYTDFATVIRNFLSEKERELRPDTIRSYKSSIKSFYEFVQKNMCCKFTSNFNKINANQYMDYLTNVH